MNIIKLIDEKINLGKKLVVATVVEKKGEGPLKLGGRLLLDEDSNRSGTIAGGDLERIIIEKCKEILENHKTQTLLYNMSDGILKEENVKVPMICGGSARIFYEYFQPKNNLFVFGGAGNVGKEICEKSKGLDFKLSVIDTINPNFNFEYDFYDGHKTILNNEFKNTDYIVIATGSHSIDYEILKNLMKKDIEFKYLGMLASSKKISDLLKTLNDEIGKEPKKIYSPIGLNIGGETPPEIAISILAQIQSIKYDIKNIEDMGVIKSL